MSETDLSQAGLDAHYKNFFQTQERDFRASAIARLVLPLLDSEREVLDVGCGSCTVTSHLLTQGLSVTSIDTSAQMVEMARRYLADKQLPSDGVHHMDMDTCLRETEASFPQIICLDVIEHIRDDASALQTLFKLLSPGGRLVLSVPALSGLFGPKDERVGHYRRYDRKELIEKVEAAGFVIGRIRWWNLLGAAILWFYLKVLRRGVNESFRSSERGKLKRCVNSILRIWCTQVENRVPFPIGLTLLVVAHRPAS